MTVPYEPIETQRQFALYRIIDPTSMFSNEFALAVTSNVPDYGFVDAIITIARKRSPFISVMLVVATALTRDLADYVGARGVATKTMVEFRDEFSKLAAGERYYVGALAARSLCEMLNIDGCYVEPDAAPVTPGDHMEDTYLKTRVRAIDLVADFIRSDDKILFLFGGYGSGKSAFCAHILDQAKELSNYTPVYYPLRQLETANDLGRVITKCRQLGNLYGGPTRPTVVILDGLDELPNAMRPDEKRMNMLRILDGAARAEKVIISSRASYFRGLDDFWRLFNRRSDDSLWRDIARLMPTGGAFPKVSAIALREFDSDQILAFAEQFAATPTAAPTLMEEVARRLSSGGSGPNYMLLARNPLYLYLLLGSRPWVNPNVRCVADVYGIFIRYWLERDIEKGKSRWNLSTDERFDFMYHVAFVMFLDRRHALHFDEFDNLVQEFFGHRLKPAELGVLALDLQTTGAFGSIGNHIHFVVPAFSDYLVARRFQSGDFTVTGRVGEPPDRMPTIDQVIMWAGMAETQQNGIDYHHSLLAKNGISGTDPTQPMILDAKLALYERDEDKFVLDRYDNESLQWRYLNGNASKPTGVRMICNAVVLHASTNSESTVLVKILNSKGLHARASARLARIYETWLDELFAARPWDKPVLWMSRQGPGEEMVGLHSIMGLMMLAAVFGSMVVIHYENCDFTEVETLLERLHCQRPTASQNYWGASLGEELGS